MHLRALSVLILLLAWPFGSQAQEPLVLDGVVVGVTDGDTVDVAFRLERDTYMGQDKLVAKVCDIRT